MNKQLFDSVLKRAEDLKIKVNNSSASTISKKKMYLFLLSELILVRNKKDLTRVYKIFVTLLTKKKVS